MHGRESWPGCAPAHGRRVDYPVGIHRLPIHRRQTNPHSGSVRSTRLQGSVQGSVRGSVRGFCAESVQIFVHCKLCTKICNTTQEISNSDSTSDSDPLIQIALRRSSEGTSEHPGLSIGCYPSEREVKHLPF